MSLIFSALAEIDKQAQGGQAEHVPMAAASTPVFARRGTIIVIAVLLILTLCLAVYLLYRSGDSGARQTQNAALSAPRAQAQAAGQIQVPQVVAETSAVSEPVVLSADLPQAAPPAMADVEQDPPYAPVRQSAAEPAQSAGNMRIRIVGGDTGIEKSGASAPPAAPALVKEQTAPLAQESQRVTTLPAATQSNLAATTPEPQTVDAARALDTADTAAEESGRMIGSNNFIKVGKQPEAVTDANVPRWVASFRDAMAQGDHAKAKTALGSLEAGLSPQSLTLLRMQAWYAVDSGNDSTARGIYTSVLQRLPDDINAGVNVALIDWRAGQHAGALQRINAMYTQHPDSDLVKRNWQVMHQQRQ